MTAISLSYGPPSGAAGSVALAGGTLTLTGTSTTYTIDASSGSDFESALISVRDSTSGRYPMYQAGVGTKNSSGTYQQPSASPTGVTITADSLVVNGEGTLATARWTFTIDGTDRVLVGQISVVGNAVKIVLTGTSTVVNSNFCGAYTGIYSGVDMRIHEGPGSVGFPTAYWTSAVGAGTVWFGHFLDITQSHSQGFTNTDPANGNLTSNWTTLNLYSANTSGAYPEALSETLWCVASTDRSDTYVYPSTTIDDSLWTSIASGPWCFLTSEGDGVWANKQTAMSNLFTVYGFEGLNVYPQFWWTVGNYGQGSVQVNGSFWKAGDEAGQAAFGAALRALGANVGAYTYPSLEKQGTGDGTAGTYDPDLRVIDADGTPRISDWGSDAAGEIVERVNATAGNPSSITSPSITIASSSAAQPHRIEVFVRKEASASTEIALQGQLLASSVVTEQMTAWVDTYTGTVRTVTASISGGAAYTTASVDVQDHDPDNDGDWWLVKLNFRDTAGTADEAVGIIYPAETGGTLVGARSIMVSDFAVWQNGDNLVPEATRTDFTLWTTASGATVDENVAGIEGPRRATYMTRTEDVGTKFESIFGATGVGLAQTLNWNMARIDVDTYSDVTRAGGDYVDAKASSTSQTLKDAIANRRAWMESAKTSIGAGSFLFGEGGRANRYSDLELLWAGPTDSVHAWWNTNAGYDESDQINYPDGKSIAQWPMMVEHERECRNTLGVLTDNNPARFFTVWEQALQDPGPTGIYPFSRAMLDLRRCYSFALRRTGAFAYVNDLTTFMPEREVVKEYYIVNRCCQRQVAVRASTAVVRYYDATEGYETEEERFDREEQGGTGRGRAAFVESTQVRIVQGTVSIWVNRSSTDWVVPASECGLSGGGVTLPTNGYLATDSSDGAVFGSFKADFTGDVLVDVGHVPGEYTLLDGRETELTAFGVTSTSGRLALTSYAGGFTLAENASGAVERSTYTAAADVAEQATEVTIGADAHSTTLGADAHSIAITSA